jgi:hypothetical protein
MDAVPRAGAFEVDQEPLALKGPELLDGLDPGGLELAVIRVQVYGKPLDVARHEGIDANPLRAFEMLNKHGLG